jgi:PAS domain S-box-containing protein
MPVRRVLLLLVSGVVLLALALAGVVLLRVARSTQVATERELERATNEISFAIDREFVSAVNVLTALKRSDRLRDGDLEAFYRTAADVARDVGYDFALYDQRRDEYVMFTGVPWGAALMRGLPYLITDEDRAALHAGGHFVSSAFLGRLAKQQRVAIGIEAGVGGAPEYLLTAVLEVDRFVKILAQARLRPDWVVTIIDRRGVIVARSKDNEKFSGERARSLEQADPSVSSGLAFGPNSEGVPFVWSYRRSPDTGWMVGAGLPQSVLREPLLFAAGSLVIVGLMVVSIAALIVFRANGPIARSFNQLRETVLSTRPSGEPIPLHRSRPGTIEEVSSILAVASAELMEVDERRRFILSASGIGAWQWDFATGEQTWSDGCRDILGLPRDFTASRENFLPRVHPADHQVVESALTECLTSDKECDYRYRVLRADNGEERWIRARTRVDRARPGKSDRLLGVMMDVTALKRAEIAVEDGASRLRALVETLPDGVVLIDGSGSVLLFNPACEKLFGYPPNEVVGRNINMLMPSPDRERHADYIAEFRRTGIRRMIGRSREIHGRRNDGSVIPLMLSVGQVKRDGELLFVGILRDLTNEKESRRERDDLLRRLMETQEEERSRLARELHDETAQLLAAALLDLNGVERLLQDNPVDGFRRLRADLEEIGRSLHRCAWELRPTSLDDLGLEKALSNYLSDWSARSGLPVDFHCRSAALQNVPTEVATHVYRIVQEALTNVRKHAASATTVSIVIDGNSSKLQVSIEDNGCGFDQESVAPTALDGPLHRSRFGIAGMRERLSLINGELEIESEPGHGTTLFIRIDPRREAVG